MASVVNVKDHLLVFVVRKDGQPGLYLEPGMKKADAIRLFRAVAERLEAEAAEESDVS